MEPFEITPIEQPSPPSFPAINPRLLLSAVVIAVILVLGAVVWWFWGREAAFSERRVSLNIEALSETPAGEEFFYLVKIKNGNERTLTEASLLFFYPADSVVIKDGILTTSLTEEIKIGEIKPDEEKEWSFSVYFADERGAIKQASAKLIFKSSETHSSFKKEAAVSTTVTSSKISLTLAAPPQSASGQAVSYLLDYRNESDEDLKDFRLRLTYSEDFSFSRGDPVPTTDRYTWELPVLKKGTGHRITVDGTLKGGEGEEKEVKVVLQRLTDGQWIDYQRTSSRTTISAAPLSVSVRVNDQPSANTAQPGDALSYQVSFINNSQSDLLNLTVTAKLEGTMFDLPTLKTSGLPDNGGRTITWNNSASPLLERLAPGQEGAVNFDIVLKSTFPPGTLGAKDFAAKVSATVETLTVPAGYFGNQLTAQGQLVTKIKSLPVWDQNVRYEDLEWGSSGPLPPKAGQKTIFTVDWKLTNFSADILKTQIRAVLPSGVDWENKTRAAGTATLPVYKSSSREVIWNFGLLPAGTGSTTPRYEAAFQISVTPAVSQTGELLSLLKNATLEGEESLTGQFFIVRGQDWDSGDLTDRGGQGVVE